MGYCGRLGPAEDDWYAPFTVTVLVFDPEPPVAITTCGSRISVPGGCDDMVVARLCARRGMLASVSPVPGRWETP